MSLEAFKPKPQGSRRRQITDAVREMIHFGELAAGSRLPATQALAAQWDATVPTVHDALTALVKEGLLERTPRVGTFVRQPEEGLKVIAVYDNGEAWRQPQQAFSRAICQELHVLCSDRGTVDQAWVDPRPAAEQGEPWEALTKAASERRIQAVIVPAIDSAHMTWLKKLPVPLAVFSSGYWPNRVYLNVQNLVREAMELLAAQGCRKVGVISVARRPGGAKGRPSNTMDAFWPAVDKTAARLGLECRPDWQISPPGDTLDSSRFEQFGYQSFPALYHMDDRPDGVFVWTDYVARGVIIAAAAEQVRIPGEMQLVLARNAEVGLFCPFPAGYVDVHAREVAAELLDLATAIYNGREPAPRAIPIHPTPNT